ncbi:hypothetical protein [Halalkalibacter sp. APA_J-10(15)]|nr:hypothetical protein [Halalkalibacter sp. APA_J-10(15)]
MDDLEAMRVVATRRVANGAIATLVLFEQALEVKIMGGKSLFG